MGGIVMKKIYIIISLILIAIMSACGNNADGWKDTHKVYGDGTYQVFNQKKNNVDIKGISNSKYHQCIVDEIVSMKDIDGILYVNGKFTEHTVYTIINTFNNKVKYYVELPEGDVLGTTNINDLISSGDFELLQSYDDFSDKEKVIFDNLNVPQ